MQTLGFADIQMGEWSTAGRDISGSGVILMVGLVGQLQGYIVLNVAEDGARKIASRLMMGTPVEALDEMACSSLRELSNMLSAHAATGLANAGYNVDISPPNMMRGQDIRISMNTDKVMYVKNHVDGVPVLLYLSIA
jgi:chemotaxis protein CheX